MAGEIKLKGCKIIEDEAVKKCPINIGEAIFTSAGTLKAKYIIHAATMDMSFKTDEVKIRNSCQGLLWNRAHIFADRHKREGVLQGCI